MRIEPTAGDTIEQTVMQALRIAYDGKINVQFRFNGIEMEIFPPTLVNQGFVHHYVLEFKNKIKLQHEEWLNSEEGKKFKQDQIDRRTLCQKNIDKAMFEASNIDWTDVKSILRWCNAIFENWIVGVNVPQEEILFIFAERGNGEHIPNQYCGEKYSGDKKAEWIIGQFLSGVKNGAIPDVFAKFYEEVMTEDVVM